MDSKTARLINNLWKKKIFYENILIESCNRMTIYHNILILRCNSNCNNFTILNQSITMALSLSCDVIKWIYFIIKLWITCRIIGWGNELGLRLWARSAMSWTGHMLSARLAMSWTGHRLSARSVMSWTEHWLKARSVMSWPRILICALSGVFTAKPMFQSNVFASMVSISWLFDLSGTRRLGRTQYSAPLQYYADKHVIDTD